MRYQPHSTPLFCTCVMLSSSQKSWAVLLICTQYDCFKVNLLCCTMYDAFKCMLCLKLCWYTVYIMSLGSLNGAF